MSTVVPLSPSARPAVNFDLITSLEALHAAIAEIEADPQLDTAVALIEVRRPIAEQLSQLNKRDPQAPVVRRAMEAVLRLCRAGALDFPLSDEDRDLLARWETAGWPGLVAAMMLTSAWRWSAAPTLSLVPDWLWADYTRWLFAAPNPLIDEEDCAAYAAHIDRHSDELARWTQRNIGSASVRAAAEAYAECAPLRPLQASDINARAAATSRAAILTRLHGRGIDPFQPFVMPRLGRALRIGFVSRQWDLDPDTAAALASFENVASDRVARILFANQEPATAFGWHCRDKAQEFYTLPDDLAAQVTMLRDSNLDVVVFVGDVAGTDHFSRLPLFRVAALQVLHSQARQTSGSAEADLRLLPHALAGASARFAERIGVLPEGASTFALRRGGDSELAYSREDLGFPGDSIVLGAVLPSTHAVADALSACVQILAKAPQTRLVLHVLPEAGRGAIALERFCALVQALVGQGGVALDRVSILAPEQASYDESRAIVRLADIFLPLGGAPIWAAEALSVGIPAIAREGVEAEWLQSTTAECAVTEAGAFVDAVVSLAEDSARRAELKQRFEESVRSGLPCADSLAASDGFVGVIESAFDRIEAQGVEKFRRDAGAFTVGSDADAEAALAASAAALEAGDAFAAVDSAQRALAIRPRDARVRAAYGRALLADGRSDRASIYLLAAVEQLTDDASLWFALATALRNDGKNSEATQALESSLRVNQNQPDGWLMLIELAEGAGAFDIAKEAYDALKQIAPEHPQLGELALRFEN